MQIFIQTLLGQTIILDVEPQETVDSIKLKIQNEGDIKGQYVLIFNGFQLEDHKTLQEYNVVKESTINLIPKLEQKENKQIHVKSMTGEIIIDYDSEDTVPDLKAKIQAQNGIPPDQQKLIFAGKSLQDETNLRDYQIFDGSTLYLMVDIPHHQEEDAGQQLG